MHTEAYVNFWGNELDQIYELNLPVSPPDEPSHWSWSSLSEWQSCPRRWWLRRCTYRNVTTRLYPGRVSAASLQGSIVHSLIDNCFSQLREGAIPAVQDFDAYHLVKTILHKELSELKGNPRVRTSELKAVLSIDACLFQFYQLVKSCSQRELEPASRNSMSARPQETLDKDAPPADAVELDVLIDDPPIWGRIDRYKDQTIIDWKTGKNEPEAKERHARQISFYALLWFLRFGVIPQLEIRYSDGSRIPVEGPNRSQLQFLREDVEQMIQEAKTLVESNTMPRANVSPDTCQFCPVKQMCDEYWADRSILEFRSNLTNSPPGSPRLCDIEVSGLPGNWGPGLPFKGTVTSGDFGLVEISIPSVMCPPRGMKAFRSARVLSGQLSESQDTLSIRTIRSTEVFWKEN